MRNIERLCQRVGLILAISLTLTCHAQTDSATTAKNEPASAELVAEIKAFADELANEQGFDAVEVESILLSLQPRTDIIARMNAPAEALPWHKYRKIWMQDKRINEGLAFWAKHQQTLTQAEAEFGVDASIIVAILGVETFYGKVQGNYPVLESLYTLGFHYPKRATFFKNELKHYWILAREQNWPLSDTLGSYAGAMGMGQFISSSYRHYGFDFNQDGKINLFNDPIDMIGSVANYFKQHRWQLGQFVAEQITDPQKIQDYIQTELELQLDFAAVQRTGVMLKKQSLFDLKSQTEKMGVFAFEQPEKQNDLWLVGDNFYVITRYNRSPLYALAVFQLSEAIKARRQDAIDAKLKQK